MCWPHCQVKEENERTAAPMRGNLSSAQGPDRATRLVGWVAGWLAGWAFLCCFHNGIITLWDKSLAEEERAVESLKPDATLSTLPLSSSFSILLTSAHIVDLKTIKLQPQCEWSACCSCRIPAILFTVCKQDRAQWLQHR